MLHRYILHEVIGQGGMGIVHRATDRLTGELVALKRVTLLEQPKQSSLQSSFSPFTTEHHKLALAQEFQILASLRHPHIMSVIDYGFDQEAQPYFTMTYVPEAQTFLEVRKGRSLVELVYLLQQMLEALVYLHQHGILHLDLKPANVLVTGNHLRLLDFGLSAAKGEASMPSGTLAYIAPEILEGDPPSEATDLYAVGVMAYEILAGHHPFNMSDRNFIDQILDEPPDLEKLNANTKLAQVVGRLLAKKPTERYAHGRDVIIDLSQSIDVPLPAESIAIRESFLQAAQFIGREKELDQLLHAMQDAKKGQGSTWLIGGESGVGKSRLIDELRIRALVNGALVMRGQEIEEGSDPYYLWRGVIKRLALGVELDDLSVSVLQTIVPDIHELVDRDAMPAPPLSEAESQQRLLSTVGELFRTQTQWMLLILEDLQWARESVGVLHYINRFITELPLLIVTSYRSDELSDLPQRFPLMQVMKLPRFSAQEMARLSSAMLGKTGEQEAVVSLLQKEAEGNAFFLVEMVRTLAEEAGRLAAIGKDGLPAKLFPQGIQTIMQRRWTRLPTHAHDLLRLAAVAGRELDLNIIANLAEQKLSYSLDDWLTICADVSFLEVSEDQWRFVHGKLRDGIMREMAESELRTAHHDVAQAITTAYPDDFTKAATLVYHWYRAGDVEQEQKYAKIAGIYAKEQYANDEAIRFLSRALDLTPDDNPTEQYVLLEAREQIYELRGKRDKQRQDLQLLAQIAPSLSLDKQADIFLRQANYAYRVRQDYQQMQHYLDQVLDLAQHMGDQTRESQALYHLGMMMRAQSNYPQAQQYYSQALTIAQEIKDQMGESKILNSLGIMKDLQAEYAKAIDYYQQSLLLKQDINDKRGEGQIYNNLGVIAIRMRQFEQAHIHHEKALQIRQEIGDRRGQSLTLTNLGSVARHLKDYIEAKKYYEQALTIAHELDARLTAMKNLDSLGTLSNHLGEYEKAQSYYEEALVIAQEVSDRVGTATSLNNLGNVFVNLGEYEKARSYYEQALTILQSLSNQAEVGIVLNNLGHAFINLGKWKKADAAYRDAINFYEPLELTHFRLEGIIGLAYVKWHQNDQVRAQTLCEQALAHLPANPTLIGAEDPIRALYYLGVVLGYLQNAYAADVIAIAYDLLQGRAEYIVDPEQKDFFLTCVPLHQKIIKLYQETSIFK